MKKTTFSGFLMSATLFIATSSIAEEKEHTANPSPPQLVGFECAKTLKESIGLLGRGTDFPAFLATDVDTELKRQDKRSQLISVECLSEPELRATSNKIIENGIEQNVLTVLSVTFPLLVKVKNGKSRISLKVEQNYLIENLHLPNQQKVTQNFIVKK
jgi:hypothetical protein